MSPSTRSQSTKKKPSSAKKTPKAQEKQADATTQQAESPEQSQQIALMAATILRLQAQNNQVAANEKRKADLSQEEKRWQQDVNNAFKVHIFNNVKWICSDKKLVAVALKLAQKWKLREFDGLTGKALEDAQAAWASTNQNVVREAYLKAHNYAQSQLRSYIVDRMERDLKVPTPEQIILCAKRDPSMMTEENQWIFDMYVDVLLFKVIGKHHWDDKYRHYMTVSEATIGQDDDAPPCITVSTEAYLCLQYLNCFKRWKHLAACRKLGKSVNRKNNPDHETDYVSTKKGQAKFGGWLPAARDKHSELETAIETGRGLKHCKKMEEECLQRLRIKNKLVDEDGNVVDKSSKKRKAIDEPVVEDDMADLDF